MRNIPTITKNLLIINILMYLATLVLEGMGTNLSYALGLHFVMMPGFHVYQLITYMFMHGGFTHLFFNMFALWMFGCVVENTLGSKRFIIYYMACGIGAGLIQELTQFVSIYFMLSHSASLTVGASGAIYGILLAFGMLYPNERIFIFPLPVPIKAKWFITFYVAVELFSAIATSGDGVAHTAHLGGMLIGFFMIRYWKRHPQGGYGRSNRGNDFISRMRDMVEREKRRREQQPTDSNPDWEYNERKKEKQEEIDRILDKIRRSGYDSLTDEEKRKLFDNK